MRGHIEGGQQGLAGMRGIRGETGLIVNFPHIRLASKNILPKLCQHHELCLQIWREITHATFTVTFSLSLVGEPISMLPA